MNLHAHLELSQIAAPFECPSGVSRQTTANWIGEILRFRRSPVYNARKGIERGLQRQELIETTSLIADIVPNRCPAFSQHYISGSAEVFPFAELIAWKPEQAETEWKALPDCYGLSPHAPHTVCPELLEKAVQSGKPLAMHLAETPEELQLLRDHSGPLLEMMRQADPDYDPKKTLPGKRPMDYLQLLAAAPLSLIIHGNYLAADEMRFLAGHRETMIVVYCPRSHAYFRHSAYPLRQMLDLGVCVALGTDSTASSPDLSMAAEVRFAAAQHPAVPPETINRLASQERIQKLLLHFSGGIR